MSSFYVVVLLCIVHVLLMSYIYEMKQKKRPVSQTPFHIFYSCFFFAAAAYKNRRIQQHPLEYEWEKEERKTWTKSIIHKTHAKCVDRIIIIRSSKHYIQLVLCVCVVNINDCRQLLVVNVNIFHLNIDIM